MRRVTKSRGGCARCKKQHLKCDEQKPSCGRCTRVGAVCPGYVQNLKWSSKYEINQQSSGSERRQTNSTRTTPASSQANVDSSNAYDWLWPDFLGVPMPGGSTITLPASAVEVPRTAATPAVAELPSTDQFNLPLNAPINTVGLVSNASATDFIPETTGMQHLDNTWLETLNDISGQMGLNDSVQLDRIQDTDDNSGQTASVTRYLPHQSTHSYVPALMQDTESLLVEFYFKEPGRLYSCYDSRLNPFVTTVSKLWQNSKVLFYSMQSMAAACLMGMHPELAPTGKYLQREALKLLNDASKCDDSHFLSILMIGGTTAWHDSKDHGLSLFTLARQRLEQRPCSGEEGMNNLSYEFFHEAIIFWELLLSFAVDSTRMKKILQPRTLPGPQIPMPFVPHPWTGFARDIQATCVQVGQLIRSQRKRAHRHGFPTQAEIARIQKEMTLAKKLEEHMLAVYVPSENEVVDPEDAETPTWHLLAMAEIYKRVGLLQLYRVFPDLLHRRMATNDAKDSSWLFKERHRSTPQVEEHSAGDLSPSPEDDEIDVEAGDEWLTRFALRTLDLIYDIPITSGTRDFQPFCLVACCSELRLPKDYIQRNASQPVSTSLQGLQNDTTVSESFPSDSWTGTSESAAPLRVKNPLKLSLATIEIPRARSLLLNRLNSFLIMLPLNPILAGIDIVKTTWDKLDSAPPGQHIYWVDVMTENGWDTCLA